MRRAPARGCARRSSPPTCRAARSRSTRLGWPSSGASNRVGNRALNIEPELQLIPRSFYEQLADDEELDIAFC